MCKLKLIWTELVKLVNKIWLKVLIKLTRKSSEVWLKAMGKCLKQNKLTSQGRTFFTIICKAKYLVA
ncbi:MAG: hypothetical protein ACTS6P_01590 [Candidatus Hodgkinia cicadicola]